MTVGARTVGLQGNLHQTGEAIEPVKSRTRELQ